MVVRVLMVDDDSVHLELSERFLTRQSSDYQIITAETSEEAIKLLKEENFDAAVCDIDLARDSISGLDILEHIRSSGKDVPVIIFTGKSREEFAIQALNLGADYYIRKSSTNIESLYAELSYYILTAVEKRKTKIALQDSELKLRVSEARLADAQRIAHSGSWVWEIEENIISWSDEIYRIFGLAPQEFSATYEAFLESVHPDDRESVDSAVNAAFNKKEHYSIDHRIIRPDGSIRFVHEEAEVTHNKEGKPVQMMGTVHDVTERIEVEALIREERDRAQKYLDLTGTMILALDTSFNVTMINQKGCDLLGYDESDVVGKNWVESFIPKQLQEQAYSHLKALRSMEHKEGPCCNFTIVTKSGEQKTIRCQDTAICDDEGNVTTILCSAQLIDKPLIEEVQEGKLAAESLTARIEWWKGVFDHSPGAIGIFDAKGLLIDANSAAVDLLGVKERENMLGLSLFKDYMLPTEVLDSVQKGKVHRFLHKWDLKYVAESDIIQTSRRDVMYVDIVLSSLLGPQGQPQGYVLHATDVTTRRVNELALKTNEEMFRTIFEESPICIELYDSDGILVGANKQTVELFGIEGIDTLIGLSLFDNPNTPDFIKEDLRKGNTVSYETRFDFSKVHLHKFYETSKTGIMHLQCMFSPLQYGKDEGLQGYIIHIQDVTDRHVAEQALMESRESYKELYNNALIGLFRVRISDGMILECNDQFAKSFSFENRQVLLDNSCFFKDFLPSSNTWAQLKGTIKEQDSLVTELAVTTKDGQGLWMRFALLLWSSMGFIEGVMSDITQEKQALEMLRKQKEELSDFAHSMSHDLKNIFQNMFGFIELIEDENDFTHLKRLQTLISETSELLDHSVALADAGLTVEEKLVKVDLDHLVKLVAESTIPELIEYIQDPLPVVKADEMKVTQIFRNLFDNAVNHGEPTKIEVKCEIKQGMFYITIRNNGIEIPEHIRSKIFTKGFTTSKSGQGFGLTIIKRIVDAHNWNIQLAHSRMTTFELIIPKQN